MFTLRATGRILRRLRAPANASPPPATTRLGDWYVNELVVGRTRLVLAVSERTLLPVLMPLAPVGTIAKRLPGALADVLRALGMEGAAIAAEMEEMK